MVDALSPEDRAHLSPDWLARLNDSADVWTLGFSLVLRNSGDAVGMGGFKGPPNADCMVEIAYGVNPDQQRRGYATEAAEAMTEFAFASGLVRVVRAHTLPEGNASARVLAKCGFHHLGDVVDPEDGPVWRWEKHPETA